MMLEALLAVKKRELRCANDALVIANKTIAQLREQIIALETELKELKTQTIEMGDTPTPPEVEVEVEAEPKKKSRKKKEAISEIE